uniref:adenylyl-sulfate kinase n=1 Tax=uncultured Sphingomonas sp. TaxID=158754 RepID=UPI0035CB25B6
MATAALPDESAPRAHGSTAEADDYSLLRFITCGSVDDGKSTLIGRLLFDAKALCDDQRDLLESAGHLDFASLVDGLSAEREQGITIDVAYRFFDNGHRKFIVADTPGHEQYTRNMITGASTADLAVVLIDARKGVLTQTRRHTYLVHLVGIRNVVLAVNKMDLVGYDQSVFDAIARDYAAVAHAIGISAITAIPIAAVTGENIAQPSPAMPWYSGSTLLQALDQAEPPTRYDASAAFAMQVQWVSRAERGFRGFAGTISSGRIAPGDLVRIVPSGVETSVARIATMDGDLPIAGAGEAVTLVLTDDVDCSRGDVVAAAGAPLAVADQFEVDLVWLGTQPMLPQRPYILAMGARTASATITDLKFRIDVNTLAHTAAKTLELNAISVCNISVDRFIPYTDYATNPHLGSFILIDRASNETVGAGMIRFALRRNQNIPWQSVDVTPQAHALQKGQTPRVLWFTGLSGAGKSTVANIVERKLLARGRHSYLLDGDNIRHGLSRDLGFTDVDRVENIRRVGEVSRILAEAGLIVLTALISPFRAEREMVRRMLPPGTFVEIYIKTPLGVAERRDTKGLYARARAGELANFTGIGSPYEVPDSAEVVIDTTQMSAEAAADRIIAFLDALDESC